MRIAALILAAGLAFTLGGCVKDDGPIVPKPLPSSTPIFASDEEALAAAEEAYGNYQVVEDQIFNAGGTGEEQVRQYATGDALDAALAGFKKFQSAGYHSVGSTAFQVTELQQYVPFAEDGVGVVSIYLCLDVSQVDVVDSSGQSVVAATRPARQAFEASFDQGAGSKLILSTLEPWTGAGVCAG